MKALRFNREIGAVALIGLLFLLSGCLVQNSAPTAHFATIPASGEAPLHVTFDASTSYDPDGTILEYTWVFGDGSKGTGVITSHTYITSDSRVYTVTLTATDDRGAQATASQTISVEPPSTDSDSSNCVDFTWPFHYDAEGDDAQNLNDEYFTIVNNCGRPIDLSGWRVSDEDTNVFEFPAGFTLAHGAWVLIHTGSGTDTPTDLYWGAEKPIWDNEGDTAILEGDNGVIINIYVYHTC